MKFFLTDTHEEKEITIRSWNGSGYGPDYFYDLEVNFPENHERVEGGETYKCTSNDYDDLKEWWKDEIFAMNNGMPVHDMDYSACPDVNIAIFAN